MKNEQTDALAVTEFLESARIAALESKRLGRRMQELAGRRDRLRSRKGEAARKLRRLLEEESRRELALACRELDCYRRVEAFIERIPGRLHRTILRRRYLEPDASWSKVGEMMERDGLSYSTRHLVRLHAEALEEAQLLWEQEGEEETARKRR